MKCLHQFLSLTFIIISVSCRASQKYISPLDYGLREATTGIERYDVLLTCHEDAIRLGKDVSYKGIDSLYLEIPRTAKGIPLSDKTDFAGLVLTVCNTVKDIYLFNRIQDVEDITVDASLVDNGEFTDDDRLNKGTCLLIVMDKNPWVKERIGYDYSHYRRDILFVQNGKTKNTVVMPYDNSQTQINCSYRPVTRKKKVFRDLVFIRSENSSYKTCLLKVSAEHNFLVKNITVSTPTNNELYGDHVFMVENCTSFSLEDVVVDGTYSQSDKFGYAFGMNNVWKHIAKRVKADGAWGVYGTNNLSDVLLDKCEINRFDIHCYGRDVTCHQCRFYNQYNSFEGTYGTILFDHCRFDRSRPFLTAGSYNVLIPVNVCFNKCNFVFPSNHPWVVSILEIHSNQNPRLELQEKSLPNVEIKNCSFWFDDDIRNWYVYRVGRFDPSMSFNGGSAYVKNARIKKGNAGMSVFFEKLKLNTK